MARIRTIKPEFPQSESMGRVSRDARLLFILLWTIVDDSGKARADSRMLARTLYPYDDGEDGAVKTSRSDIEQWLAELEEEKCVARYVVEGNTYLQICNWLNHQKIDKPTPSKLPDFDESSRIVAKTREDSRRLVVGSGSGSGSGRDLEGTVMSAAPTVGPVDRVFDHWRSEWKHPKASLDPKRRRAIQAALKLHDEPTLCQAISGYRNSPHHLGENEQRTVYDDIELFLRDAKHIEAGLRFARGPPAPTLSPVAAARQKLRESINGHGRVVSEQTGTSEGSVGQAAGVLR